MPVLDLPIEIREGILRKLLKPKPYKSGTEIRDAKNRAEKENRVWKKHDHNSKPVVRVVTFQEKQYIANSMRMLPDHQQMQARFFMKRDVPLFETNSGSETELDIEQIPNATLLQLLRLVKK